MQPSSSSDAHLAPDPTPRSSTQISISQLWTLIQDLRKDLTHLQQRLGTAEEEPEDFMRAHQLGHEICNKLLIVQMLAELQALEREEIEGIP